MAEASELAIKIKGEANEVETFFKKVKKEVESKLTSDTLNKFAKEKPTEYKTIIPEALAFLLNGRHTKSDERSYAFQVFLERAKIYDIKNNVTLMSNTMIDGATYQGTVASPRNIVLTIKDTDNFAVNRDMIDIVFAEGKPIILTVEDEEHSRIIECFTESVETTATPRTRHTTISLLCPDPFFYDDYLTTVLMSDFMNNFEWPHEFIEDGEEFSYYNIAIVIE